MSDYITISELTQYINLKFERDPYLERVYLTGEISNSARNNPNGHQYFTLKDKDAQIPAVMFKNDYQKSRFKLREGEKVLVIGRISLYKPQGRYQIIIEHMEPDGVGQLYRQYEETKERLSKEGIFNLPKKPIPLYPKRIAVITSQSGAVIHDIMQNVKRRYPIVQLVLYPVVVQGKASADSVVKSLKRADKSGQFDTIIVGRGGGSFEDLFSFNEESVVRAIVESQTPIISSVGHETDTTLSDFVADKRASTPTEAAVLATPVLADEIDRFDRYSKQLINNWQVYLNQKAEQVQRLTASYVFKQPERLYTEQVQRLDVAKRQLVNNMERNLNQEKQRYNLIHLKLTNQSPNAIIQREKDSHKQRAERLNNAIGRLLKAKQDNTNNMIYNLDLLSPLKILSRGYALSTKEGSVTKSVDQLTANDLVTVRLSDGEYDATVNEIRHQDENEESAE